MRGSLYCPLSVDPHPVTSDLSSYAFVHCTPVTMAKILLKRWTSLTVGKVMKELKLLSSAHKNVKHYNHRGSLSVS